MSKPHRTVSKRRRVGPRGGMRVSPSNTRGWRWEEDSALLSAPVRCKREQWYLTRVRLTQPLSRARAWLDARFYRNGERVGGACLELTAAGGVTGASELLGWIQTPKDATHIQVHLSDATFAAQIDEVLFQAIAERDPVCHPSANVPAWSTYRLPFAISRIILPRELRGLETDLTESSGAQAAVEVRDVPRSRTELAAITSGAACVIDKAWVTALDLGLRDLQALAESSWIVIDLATFNSLLHRSGEARTQLITHAAGHDIMSARIDYADVATRGFALQDAVPYSTVDDEGAFRVRAIRANRDWKRLADETGFATLLSTKTPWETYDGDVLSAARAAGRGELIASDLPWLVSGALGPLLAPRVARHLLRMHLGRAIDDRTQYWNRSHESDIVVRDIADLARRFAPLKTVRWASSDPRIATIGVTLAPGASPARRLVLRTGRIDLADAHDGVPPEPMIIFIKTLAREFRSRADWACRRLGDLSLTWQFETAAGLRYAVMYESAGPLIDGRACHTLDLRMGFEDVLPRRVVASGGHCESAELADDVGVFGDGSLEFQGRLDRLLRGWIERCADASAGV